MAKMTQDKNDMVSKRAEQCKPGKYNTGHGRVLVGMVEWSRAVQGRVKTEKGSDKSGQIDNDGH